MNKIEYLIIVNKMMEKLNAMELEARTKEVVTIIFKKAADALVLL